MKKFALKNYRSRELFKLVIFNNFYEKLLLVEVTYKLMH